MKIASLVLLACFITYASWGSEGLGKRCESIELNNVVAMGCGDYIENTVNISSPQKANEHSKN